MVYPVDFEQKLGFDLIRQRLNSYCLSSLGEKKIDKLTFLSDPSQILVLLNRNKEMCSILSEASSMMFSNFFDPEESYQLIAVEGAFLEEETFHQMILSLNSLFAAKAYLNAHQEQYPFLNELLLVVTLKRSVLTTMESKFDEAGKVRDSASVELGRIRKRLRDEQGRVRKIAEQIFREASEQGWVPEGLTPSIREGRVVVPILATHKRRIRGLILDESSTGQTVFMEPADVMEASNEMRELQLAERREVVKVLQELTSGLRNVLEELRSAFNFLAELDFARAKAKVAMDLEAKLPHIVPQPDLDWKDARHPLLFLSSKGKRSIVPLTLQLTRKDHFLLVSGPNAGGKSVCLKTVGLLQYMMQCGLLVPMDERSTMGVFQHIFLDIGDQQSIENDLSTYSSHLRNMRHFIQHGSEDALVLIDELGSGTDPNFGGGIAQAILGELVRQKNWGVVTTHYYNLKVFAEQTAGIVNGAMLFDTQKLEPLFMLEVGKPGSSFALEIAKKIGLPDRVLGAAEGIIGKELTGLETLMKTVADEKNRNARHTRELVSKEQALDQQLAKFNRLSAELESRKKEIIEKAKNEAATLLKQTNREIEKTIRHIRENKAEKKETRKVRAGLRDLSDKVKFEKEQEVAPELDIKVGDKVRIRGQEVSGTVLQLKGKQAIVQFGHLHSQVQIIQLIRSDQVDSSSSFAQVRTHGINLVEKQSGFHTTLDVRGRRVEEVIPLVNQFLDDAILLGQGHLRILHGKGEGILRKVVRDQLKANKAVATFANEHVEQGGDGITTVVLK